MPRFGDSVTASPFDSNPNGGSAKITFSFLVLVSICFVTEMPSTTNFSLVRIYLATHGFRAMSRIVSKLL
jgi:hypothetical protein